MVTPSTSSFWSFPINPIFSLLLIVVVLTKDFLICTGENRRKREERERDRRREKAEKRYREIDGRIT